MPVLIPKLYLIRCLVWKSQNKLPQCLWIHMAPEPSITPNPHKLTWVNVTISHLWCPGDSKLVKPHQSFPQAADLNERKAFFWLNLARLYCFRSFLHFLKCHLFSISQVPPSLMLLNSLHCHAILKCFFLCKQQCVAESFGSSTVAICFCCRFWQLLDEVANQFGCDIRKENLKGNSGLLFGRWF